MTALAPSAAYTNPGPPVNNDSLVLRLQYGRATALLEGDAEGPSEQSMIAAALRGGPPIGPNTLLKVGHHGSRTSTTQPFLDLAEPRDAVISVGRDNTFGHPRPEIVERLAEAHAHVFRTDRFGLTTFVLSPEGGIAARPNASNY
jgi:competence protein ComEC